MPRAPRASTGSPSATPPWSPPDGAPLMALVELGRFNYFEAQLLVSRLESDGIPAFAFDGGASIADGSHFLIPVRAMVDDEDLAAAELVRDTPEPDPA